MSKIFLFLIPALLLTGNAWADSNDNVSGFAWSENIGWISFNCTDTTSCGAVDYGVNIDPESEEFSGHAWSENIGWISFNRAETGAPPEQPYKGGGLTYIAKANLDTGEVTGWARTLSATNGEWDGWIKLSGDLHAVSISTGNGDFSGFAWSGEVIGVLGWISFNCADTGVCGTSNYKVRTALSFNQPPAKPGVVGESWNHCSIQGKSIPTFTWTYSDPDGDSQAAYEIEVDSNSSFQAPKFNHVVNTGSTSYALDLSQDDDADWLSELAWNTTYFWRVRVKDSSGNWSDWSNSDQLKTPFHAYPWPDFSWAPQEPSQGEVVVFNPDASIAYGGASIRYYDWAITRGIGTFVDETRPTSQYPHVVFSAVDNQMRLRAFDSDNYSCETAAENITAHLPLPEYRETPPATWLRQILDFFSFLTSWQKFATMALR